MRSCAPALLCALALLPAARAASPPAHTHRLARLMALLAHRRHRVATFVEEDSLRALTRPLRSSGVLVYEAPARLEERILEPRRITLIADHGMLSATRAGHTYRMRLNAHAPIAPFIDALREMLSGNRAALARQFKLSLSGTLARWTLTLRPRAPRSPIRRIRIEGARAGIRSVAIAKANGDHSRMTLGPAPGR